VSYYKILGGTMEITLAETKHTNPIRKLREKKKKKKNTKYHNPWFRTHKSNNKKINKYKLESTNPIKK
jgi:hypothetical protein